MIVDEIYDVEAINKHACVLRLVFRGGDGNE